MNPTLLYTGSTNCTIEGIAITGVNTALRIQGGSLFTIKDCVIANGTGAAADMPALSVDSCFWGQTDNLQISTGGASGGSDYAAEFTTDTDIGPSCCLWYNKHWIVNGKGILFRGVFGPHGSNSMEFKDLHSEDMTPGYHLINCDSTLNRVGNLRLIRLNMSDPVGGGNYYIHNVGDSTQGIYLLTGDGNPNLITPTSDTIINLYIDHSVSNNFTSSAAEGDSLNYTFAASGNWRNWTYQSASCIDTRLLTAPVGPTWVPGTPLAVQQDPTTWVALGGVVTPGQRAPDGSTQAGHVIGGTGIRVYNASHNLALGDWLIGGVWIRSAVDDDYITDLDGLTTTTAGFNWSDNRTLGGNTEDMATNGGWRWFGVASKVTAVGVNPCLVRFQLSCDEGYERTYFAPCLSLIPATDGWDDGSVINFVRSLKGGWSSGAAATSVSLLDHQLLYAKGGVEVTDEVYDATNWNGDLTVPTKNAIRDKLESLSLGFPADPGQDRVLFWDDSDNAVEWASNADLLTEAAPATGDFLLLYGAEGDLRKVNWNLLPGASSLPADPGADRVLFWDDSDGAAEWATLADLTTEAAPAAGDYVLAYGAEGDVRKVNWNLLPGGGGSQTPWTSDIDGATFDLANVATATFGNATPITFHNSALALVQVLGTTGTTGFSGARFSNDANPLRWNLAKSRGASIGTFTTLNNNDSIGEINFEGANMLRRLTMPLLFGAR